MGSGTAHGLRRGPGVRYGWGQHSIGSWREAAQVRIAYAQRVGSGWSTCRPENDQRRVTQDGSGFSSHSVMNWGALWIAVSWRRSLPELTNRCGVPDGATAISPAPASIVVSPIVMVPLPAWTTKTSS